jgi:hypothetical protein
MTSLTITLPIYWEKTFKTKPSKVVLTGMNWYRCANYFDQNRFKQEFSDLVKSQLGTAVSTKLPYTLNILLYYKNPSCDPSNIVPLVEKVLLDVLQKEGCIKQDNVKYHLGTTWCVAGQDKENPRCEITITPQEPL